MPTKPLASFLAALLLALPGCAPQQQGSPAGTAAAPMESRPALWAVRDADTTVYLFGTVHVLRPGVAWFDGPIKAAFDASDELVLEVVEPDQAAMAQKVGAMAVAADGTPLSQKLDEKARANYIAAMTANGIAYQMFEPFKPWMAGLTLAVAPLGRLGYSAEEGVEKVLTAAARAMGKRVGELETVEQQLGYFDTLPPAQQIAFLNATVDGLPEAEREFAALIAAWQKGETEALARQMNGTMDATPELAQVLLYNRNANWARWIAERMKKPGTVFVAVGAGHLAGPKDVRDALRALGLEAKRVPTGVPAAAATRAAVH